MTVNVPQIRYTTTLDYLMGRYPPSLTVQQVGEITSESEGSIRNAISRGRYPIPSFRIGRKRVFRLLDVAAYIDQQFAAANKPKIFRKRGRPTKVEQVARRQMEQAK